MCNAMSIRTYTFVCTLTRLWRYLFGYNITSLAFVVHRILRISFAERIHVRTYVNVVTILAEKKFVNAAVRIKSVVSRKRNLASENGLNENERIRKIERLTRKWRTFVSV